MNAPLCIAMAGPAGCSKTPVAFYLSQQLNMPIFSNDAIRTEVREDTLKLELDIPKYLQRRDQRKRTLIAGKTSFIYEASIDRSWAELKAELAQDGYRWLVISFDLSFEFWQQICQAKGYKGVGREQLDKWFKDHQNFRAEFGSDVGLEINDANFLRRMSLALEAVQKLG